MFLFLRCCGDFGCAVVASVASGRDVNEWLHSTLGHNDRPVRKRFFLNVATIERQRDPRHGVAVAVMVTVILVSKIPISCFSCFGRLLEK